MQVLLMNAAEGAQIRPKHRAGPLTGVTVHFALAISVVITCPFVEAVAHRSMGRMAVVIALPFIRVQERALRRDIRGDQARARTPVRMVAHPKALLPRLARDHTDDGGGDHWQRYRAPSVYSRVGVAGRRGRDEAYVFSPAFW
jgi:hypothetical protein